MTRNRWILLGLILALLVAIQHFGLERQPETLNEAPLKRVAGLPPSDVLPTYVATLFFGAFRAVAVDLLWIQLRKAKEEKRWYEMQQLTQFISYVQPRNPEVWSHLAWESAYNVAAGFTNRDTQWKWVKFGLRWIRKGISTLPNEPYLKDQLAYTLWHKPSWMGDGQLDYDLLKRIESDAELQTELLPDGVKYDRPRTAFELAIPWLELAREELLDRDPPHALTQMGRYIYPDTEDGFARLCMILQGMYEWKHDRREEAKAWFRRAQKQCDDMIARTPEAPPRPDIPKKYRNPISPIFADWAKMYLKYPEIVDLEYKARGGRLEDQMALLRVLQGVLVEFGPIDDQWFWNRNSPHALLNALKMKMTKGLDTQECNDTFDLASDLNPGDLALANLAPEGLDVDYYGIVVYPPPQIQPPPAQPPKPVVVSLDLKPEAAGFRFKATFYDQNRKKLREELVTQRTVIKMALPEYGRYFLKVEADPPEPPWPPDTRYRFQYALEH